MLNAQQTPPAETRLRREWRTFWEYVGSLADCFFNFIFELTRAGAWRRLGALILIMLVSGLILGLSTQPWSAWIEQARKLLIYLLNPFAAKTYAKDYLREVFTFTVQAFLAPQNLRYLFLGLAAMSMTLQMAASYLADIFEVPAHIARRFIWNVAFRGKGGTLTIRGGEVVNKDSPVYIIGGPGKVVVELDSAALFEKADGTPHVIGPTTQEAVDLDGFERFRQAIILRDHHVDLRQEDREISARTADGIRVSAIDVSMRYSVYRGNKQPTRELPYPYHDDSTIETLIYTQTVAVREQPGNQSDLFTLQITPSIRNELIRFVSLRKLTEFLASYGNPELEKRKQQEQKLSQDTQQIAPIEVSEDHPDLHQKPTFAPRPEISELFRTKFQKMAAERGFQLNWIGVGTWKTPAEIVPNQHQEAWRISLENLERGSETALQQVEQEACLEKILELIRDVPLARFQENMRKNVEYKETLRDLLVGYREQLCESLDFLRKKGGNNSTPQTSMNEEVLREAIGYLDQILNWTPFHRVQSGDYPSSS